MPEIRPLPAEEVEKIAAGEVVERPVSAVKELVENALDAGARHVTVELEDGGKQLLRIIDDGCGIPFGELSLAVRNFHTSKIRACDDIYHQTSLGFRGEALAALGAVSHFTITSRTANDEMGGEIAVDGGIVSEARRAALNPGTIVEIRELFFNTPVRRKFLRSRATELLHTVNMLRNYILAFPEVAFRLLADGKELVASGGRGLTQETLHTIFGGEVAPRMSRFEREFPPLGVSGLIGPPSAYRESRQNQFFFVNGRPVKNRVLYRAVDDALGEWLSPGRFPPLVLCLDIPPEEVDVNIHPTKSEVSFLHQQQVYSAVVVALKDAARSAGAAEQSIARDELGVQGVALAEAEAGETAQGSTSPHPFARRTVPVFEMSDPAVREVRTDIRGTAMPVQISADSVVSLTRELGFPCYAHPAGKYFACQIAAAYILLVRGEALTLIDQHAAHERVLFSRLWARLAGDESPEPQRQKLLFPQAISVEKAELEVWRESLEMMRGIGFIVRIGEGEALVDEVPRLLIPRGDEARIEGVLREIAQAGRSKKIDASRKEMLAQLACKGAIKAGEALRPPEIQLLIDELLSLENAASCPHGRPTMVKLGADELAKMFRRT
jgi:DNA mismatch repair protein MutL